MKRLFLTAFAGFALLLSTHLMSAAAPLKARVCHGAAWGQGRVLEVGEQAVPEHFSHGDTTTNLPKGAACSADEEVPQ